MVTLGCGLSPFRISVGLEAEIFLTFLIMLGCSNATAEDWYVLVDIGNHTMESAIKEKKLGPEKALDQFRPSKNYFIPSPDFKQVLISKIDTIKLQNKGKYRQLNIYLDSDNPISIEIKKFSKKHINIIVKFLVGGRRWHRYYEVLANYLIPRNVSMDKLTKLEEIEKKYTASYKGIKHGSRWLDLKKQLGEKFQEYPGQSLQYRQIYYPKHNLSVVIQDGIVMYLERLKPGWVGIKK